MSIKNNFIVRLFSPFPKFLTASSRIEKPIRLMIRFLQATEGGEGEKEAIHLFKSIRANFNR